MQFNVSLHTEIKAYLCCRSLSCLGMNSWLSRWIPEGMHCAVECCGHHFSSNGTIWTILVPLTNDPAKQTQIVTLPPTSLTVYAIHVESPFRLLDTVQVGEDLACWTEDFTFWLISPQCLLPVSIPIVDLYSQVCSSVYLSFTVETEFCLHRPGQLLWAVYQASC